MLSCLHGSSQGYLSFNYSSNGTGVRLGYLNDVQISLGYQTPLLSAENANIADLSVGKRILLTNNDEDNFSVTPTVGVGFISYKDFTKYDQGGEIESVKKVVPVYGLELGKDWYIGRLFIHANYANKFYYGIGIRAFFK